MGTSHPPPDEPKDELPEPLEDTTKAYKTGKRLYRAVRQRWGRVAAVGAVCALVILVIWWKWPDIKERPGVEPIAEWVDAEFKSIPICDGKNFCVAVADLQNDPDDKLGSRIVDEVEKLQDVIGDNEESGQGPVANTGIEVIRIPRTISISGNKTRVAEARAYEEAQRYLEKSRSDVVIWGSMVEVGDKSAPRIFWTTSETTKRSSNLLDTNSLELPAEFWKQLASMLQLVVVTQYTQASAQQGHYAADKLAPFIDKVRALIPQTKGAGWTNDSRFQVKTLLATSLGVYGEQVGDDAPLKEAIGYFQELLQEYPRKYDSLEWAKTQHNLGTALADLGERESGTDDLQQAVAAYSAALLEYTRERVPLDWARTQNNLGNALAELGEREAGTDDLQQAVGAYRAALLEYTREHVPLDWAMTENNLGNALDDLGQRESGTDDLRQAVIAYRAALLERTPNRDPLDWATTQDNLGTALDDLGQRESGTGDLRQAVAAYHLALPEFTRERVPLKWATTQNNLGNALAELGEHESGTDDLQQAVVAYRAALLEYTRERVPMDWAATQNNLGAALEDLGKRESGTNDLQQAVAAFRLALLEYTREHVPLDWAMTQNNLGNALQALGERESGTGDLQQAVAAFRLALLERTHERVPLDWAKTESNLGNALRDLGERNKDSKQLCDALQAHASAWQVFNRSVPFYASQTVQGVQMDLIAMSKQGPPTVYAACLANNSEVLRELVKTVEN